MLRMLTGTRWSISIIVIAVLLITACAPAQTKDSQSKGGGSDAAVAVEIPKAGVHLSKWESDTPKPGGRLQRATGAVAPSLDLIAEGTLGTWGPISPAYNSLLEYHYKADDKMGFPSDIRPGLAERWEISKDGKTYTFYLRKGVKFHDGVEFTSQDAKFSLQRMMTPPPKTPSLRAGWYTEVVEKTETPDQYTFVVTLKEVDAAFTKKIAAGYTPMVPKHILEPFNSRITDSNIDKVVGTGPYKLIKGKREVSWHLDKNNDYWKKDAGGRQLPYLEGIDNYVMIEEAAAGAAFESGQLDTTVDAQLSDERLQEILHRMGDKVAEYKQASVGGLGGVLYFNVNRKPYDDLRVRKAIMMSIDWRGIEKVVYQGRSCIGGYMPPQGEWGISCGEVAKMKGYGSATDADKAEAKKLLAEAGYPNGFEANMLMGYGPTNDQLHQMYQPMLAEIGIKVNLRPLERTAYYNAMTTGDFEMNSMGAIASIDDPNDHIVTWVICAGGRNYGQFCDPKVEEMFKAQAREMDFEKRKKLYRDLELYLLEQSPLVNSWNTGLGIGILNRTYLKGWLPMGGRHTQQLWDTAWIDKS